MSTLNSNKEYKTEIFILDEIKRVKELISTSGADKSIIKVMKKYKKKLKNFLLELRYNEIKKVTIEIKLVYVNSDVCDVRLKFSKSTGVNEYDENINFEEKDVIKMFIVNNVYNETKLSFGDTTFTHIFEALSRLNNSYNKTETIVLTTSLS
jgi:geranylgeranyl pyrophosphate synthase